MRESDVRRLIDSISLPISIVDGDFNIRLANKKMIEYFGNIEGKKCYSAIHGSESPHKNCRIIAYMREIRDEMEFYEDSMGRWFKTTVNEIDLDGDKVFIHIMDDITELKNVQSALKESEEKYRTLVEKSHDAIYITDGDVFLFVNDKVCELTGYSKDELYNMYPFSIIHPEDRNRLMETAMERLKGANPPETFEARILRKNGEIRYCDFSVSTIEYEGKKAILGTVRDKTEKILYQNELRKREELYRTLVETIDDVVFTLDLEGKFTFISNNITEKTGYSREELIGKHFTAIIPEEYHDMTLKTFKKGIESGEDAMYEIEILTKHGDRLPLEINMTTIFENGKIVGRIGVGRDISERKSLERDLQSKNELLRLINKILRHDILNDLSVIEGATDLLEDFIKDDGKQILEAIRTATQRGIELIEDMRELEKITGKGEFKPISLREVSIEIMDEFEKEYDIKWEIKGECIAYADDTIKSVISNIVRNSIIHGESEKIDIQIQKKKDVCEIEIIDYGKGIPDEIKDKVFEEGFTYGEKGRTGLGLFIVKKVVERYGGEVKIRDNDPRGTIVSVRLRPFS